MDIHCRKLAAQLHYKNKNTFKPVMISPDGPLQKQQYVHGLKYDVTMATHSVVPIIPHEFHDSKQPQGTIHKRILLVAQIMPRYCKIYKHVQHLCQKIIQYTTTTPRNTLSPSGSIGYGHYR